MREFQRTERLGAELRRDLAAILQDTVRDPRLGVVTIQEVRVSKNLSDAKVFFTCFNGDPKVCTSLLNKTMSGFLRRELAHRVRMRMVPQLHFVHDESVEYGANLTDLINKAISSNNDDNASSNETS